MSSLHKSGNFKQKNKAFKGSSTYKKSHKIETVVQKVTKKIKKAEPTKWDRRNISDQQKLQKAGKREEELKKLLSANSQIDKAVKEQIQAYIKQNRGTKIVLFIGFNEAANPLQLKNALESYINSLQQKNDQIHLENIEPQKSDFEYKFPFFQFYSNPNQCNFIKINNFLSVSMLKQENFIFIACNRDSETILDYCKVADVICPILSCKDCNPEKINLDPYQNSKAFDQFGYDLLSLIRVQGLAKTVCILQDLNLFSQSQKPKIKKLFQRYFESEFNDNFISIETNEHFIQLIRQIQSTNLNHMEWRDMRGYMLADKIEYDNQTQLLKVQGFLKGSHLNANQLVHITGYDDYQISHIEVLRNPYIPQHKKKNKDSEMEDGNGDILFTQHSSDIAMESLQSLITQQDIDNDKLLNEIGCLDLGQEEQKHENIEKNSQKSGSEMEEDDDEEFSDEENYQTNQQMMEEKKKIQFDMTKRDPDDLEFEDEVDYDPDILLKERYEKYQGLQSFKTSEWDINQNLPDEYQNIFTFKNYQTTRKQAIQESIENAFAYAGFYIKIYIKDFNIEQLKNHGNEKPIIISSLFKHERKMTQIHCKVQQNTDLDYIVRSKTPFHFSIGFRRFVTTPIFSRIYSNNPKTKYIKEAQNNGQVLLCSFYYQCLYTPANVLMFEAPTPESQFTLKSAQFILKGELVKADNYQIILKRIILTGYPFKIHKRKSTIRYMFFNTEDINYFQPIELKTKLGLRGRILESLGTHGLMKCAFNTSIKPHDTVMIQLYKRVFPNNLKHLRENQKTEKMEKMLE